VLRPARGEYLTEDQCVAICEHYQARQGGAVKADVFRLGYLLGIRKGQLQRTLTRHVVIEKTKATDKGVPCKLSWPGEETKNGKAHEVVLVGETQEIVRRAWEHRRADCEHLFHVNGKPLGPMVSELRRTCALLGIPYGRNKGLSSTTRDTPPSPTSSARACRRPSP
jgi:integrase